MWKVQQTNFYFLVFASVSQELNNNYFIKNHPALQKKVKPFGCVLLQNSDNMWLLSKFCLKKKFQILWPICLICTQMFSK